MLDVAGGGQADLEVSRVKKVMVLAGLLSAGALVAAACSGTGTQTFPPPFPTVAPKTVTPSGPTATPNPTGATPTAARPTATRPAATATPTASAPTATAAQPGGDPEAGKQVFLNLGCTSCHTIQSLPQARGTIGPNLTRVGANAATRVPGMAAEAYIRQSELDPGAFVVQGFPNVMPKLAEPGKDLDNLIAFLLSLK